MAFRFIRRVNQEPAERLAQQTNKVLESIPSSKTMMRRPRVIRRHNSKGSSECTIWRPLPQNAFEDPSFLEGFNKNTEKWAKNPEYYQSFYPWEEETQEQCDERLEAFCELVQADDRNHFEHEDLVDEPNFIKHLQHRKYAALVRMEPGILTREVSRDFFLLLIVQLGQKEEALGADPMPAPDRSVIGEIGPEMIARLRDSVLSLPASKVVPDYIDPSAITEDERLAQELGVSVEEVRMQHFEEAGEKEE